MKAIRDVLADRKRRQSGSVLSAVLIITAFLAIIAGALGTEISTNFLLSNALVNRVKTEATVNSAAELAINQLQGTPLNQTCPGLGSYTVNQQMAVVAYKSCALVVDRRTVQAQGGQDFVSVASSSQFNVDGTLAQLGGLNDYVVGDSGGTVFAYGYGSAVPRWRRSLGGSVTGSPLVTLDPDNSGQFLDLIPMSGCATSTFCVIVLSDNGGPNPSPRCSMPTVSAVVSRPAAGSRFPNNAFFGDTSGNIYAFDTSAAADGDCTTFVTASVANRVVAGPVVFACGGCGSPTDYVFVLTTTGGSSSLARLTYTQNGLSNPTGSINFPWANAKGMAFDAASMRLAISFGGGQVALVQLNSGGGMSQAASPVTLPTGISRAPYWSGSLIGIGGQNGSLYVLDTSLNTYASYTGSRRIDTTPVADGAGDWYFGASDGRFYEVQKLGAGTTMTLAVSFGAASAPFGSSPVIAMCPAGICIYVGSLDARAYLIPLDARDAVMTACINSCAGTGPNPRLWTHIQVGVAGNSQTVHVQGWSYYSP
jgi:hypothetical protein